MDHLVYPLRRDIYDIRLARLLLVLTVDLV